MDQKKNKITGNLFTWFRNFGSKSRPKTEGALFLPVQEQINGWRKASRKMDWAITDDEFDTLEAPPLPGDEDRIQGFTGAVLFYGFGEDDAGNSDAVLSGQLA